MQQGAQECLSRKASAKMTVEGGSQVGGAPTTRTENLEAAATELAPHLSLGRVESSARLLLGAVTLAGALLGGFGALGSTVVADHPAWALPSLGLIAISVALAAWSAIGSADEVQVDDLEDVSRYYDRQIEVRGALVRWAALALAFALLLAPLPAIRAATAGDDGPELELNLTPATKDPDRRAARVAIFRISAVDDLLRRSDVAQDSVDLRVQLSP
jgi:hypothetical protein